MLSILLASALAASVNAIDTISVKGSKFFTESGNQFFVKGMRAWAEDDVSILTQ